MKNTIILRAPLLHCLPSPSDSKTHELQWIDDGCLEIVEGKYGFVGTWNDYQKKVDSKARPDRNFPQNILCPGLIDTHVHFPQMEMIGSFGEHLLEWLEKYTFPTETKYQDQSYCERMAQKFFQQLLGHGTTSAFVYATVHKSTADILFQQAKKLGMCIGTGKIHMDRNVPSNLSDQATSGYQEAVELIESWQGIDRLHYVVTPRFAPTSTPEQLQLCRKLREDYPSTYLQTHLSENKAEIDWVKELFGKEYFQVYQDFGLTGRKSLFGHCLHLSEKEWDNFLSSESVACFCPTSNSFLGSGLFDIHRAKRDGHHWALATDVGAGTSLSMWKTMGHAYTNTQLAIGMGQSVSDKNQTTPSDFFYGSTLGAARALGLAEEMGSFESGKFADLQVLTPAKIDLLQQRLEDLDSPEDKLFALMISGDDRMVTETLIAGKTVYNSEK